MVQSTDHSLYQYSFSLLVNKLVRMKLFRPLALLIAAARAQLILGALALIEFTIEILEAAEVVATV